MASKINPKIKDIHFVSKVKAIAKKKVLPLSILAKAHIVDIAFKNNDFWKRVIDNKILPKELEDYINNDHKKTICTNVEKAVGVIELIGHTDIVTSMYLDHDSRYIITGSADKTARVWDLDGKRCTAILKHDNYITHVFLNIEMKLAIVVEDNMNVFFWDITAIKNIKNEIFSEKIVIVDVMKINNVKRLVLRTISNIYIYDICSLQSVEKVKYYSMFFQTNYFRYNIDPQSSNVTISNNKSGFHIVLDKRIDEINDIAIIEKNGCNIVASASNSIDIWGPKGRSVIVGENIGKPLIIKSCMNNAFIFVTQILSNVFGCFKIAVNSNPQTGKLTCKLKLSLSFYLPLLSTGGNYRVLDIHNHKGKKKKYVVFQMYNDQTNYIFWLLAIIPSHGLTENNMSINYSLINPILICKEFTSIYSYDMTVIEDILNGISIKTVFTGYNTVICNSNQRYNYLLFSRISGRCIIYQMSYYTTMEQELLFDKIVKHSKTGTVLGYDPWYERILIGIDKGVLALIISQFGNVLKEYIDRYGLEEKSQQKFNKSLNKLELREICELYGHKYHQEIHST